MAESGRLKSQDIPFLIDGVVKIVKSVNKHTTCNDVISKLPNLQCPLAVFESVNGVEKELASKAKLLKVWRAHGPSSRVSFVVKKSEALALKRSKAQKSQNKRKTTRESLKKVTDLAFYVRYQKTKVQNMKRKLEDIEKTCDERAQKAMRHFSSSSSVDSMDAFLAKADLEKMSQFLAFCGGVTEEHLGLRKSPKSPRDQEVPVVEFKVPEEVKQVNKNIIHSSLQTMKLGFKNKFASKNKVTKRTTSDITISSTESGYQSATSEGQGQLKNLDTHKRHAFVDSDLTDVPRHSTPLVARTCGKVHTLTEELDPFNLTTFDEAAGKDAILKKFMADQVDGRASIGCYGYLPEFDGCDESAMPSRLSLPAFSSQRDRCRYLWDKYCDSDSDNSSIADDEDTSDVWNASALDNAFLDSHVISPEAELPTPRNRTLRRESAISNLAKFSLAVKPINIEDDDDSFDYSFDCTFPRMDASQSVDFTGCCDGDFSHLNANTADVGVTSFDGDSDVDLTSELLKDMCDSEDSFVCSDEGIGSMSSGSLQDIVYI